MSRTRSFAFITAFVAFQGAAHAAPEVFTAHISESGTVLDQSPKWITGVERRVQNDYLTEYALSLDANITQADPRFCSVSPIDTSQYERLLHGQGKVIGKPRAAKVTVATQLVDLPSPSGDNSLEFQLMCTR